MELPITSPCKFNLLTRILSWIAGADDETLKQCPPRDVTNIRAIAWLMLSTLCYQTALFSLIGELLFAPAGQVRPEIIAGAFTIGVFILLIDRYMVIISGYHSEGLKELARAGLDVSGGVLRRIKTALFLCIRIGVLSVGLAQLSAIFFGLVLFAKDIHARIEHSYLQANAVPMAAATALVNAQIRRASDAVTAQVEQVRTASSQVLALRQSQIDPSAANPEVQEAQQEVSRLTGEKTKADEEVRAAQAFATDEYGGVVGAPGNSGLPGYGPRYRAALERLSAARAHADEIGNALDAARERLEALRKKGLSASDAIQRRANEQLPAFEKTLEAQNAERVQLEGALAKLIAGRDKAIREAVENAPDHVGYDDGFLAQIAVLERIAQDDPKIKLVIILIDVVSFGLELTAVLAKVLGFAPTTFAVMLARDVYMNAVRIADQALAELNKTDKKDGNDGNDDPEPAIPIPDKPNLADGQEGSGAAAAPESAENAVPQPLKRKRGRPRKHPHLTIVRDASKPGESRPPPDQPGPA